MIAIENSVLSFNNSLLSRNGHLLTTRPHVIPEKSDYLTFTACGEYCPIPFSSTYDGRVFSHLVPQIYANTYYPGMIPEYTTYSGWVPPEWVCGTASSYAGNRYNMYSALSFQYAHNMDFKLSLTFGSRGLYSSAPGGPYPLTACLSTDVQWTNQSVLAYTSEGWPSKENSYTADGVNTAYVYTTTDVSNHFYAETRVYANDITGRFNAMTLEGDPAQSSVYSGLFAYGIAHDPTEEYWGFPKELTGNIGPNTVRLMWSATGLAPVYT